MSGATGIQSVPNTGNGTPVSGSVLVVEDGSAYLNANAYCDAAYATNYHAARGNARWAQATQAQQEAAIIAATTFIDARYGLRWKGWKAWPLNRSRTWPRINAIASTSPALVALGVYKADPEYVWGAGEIPPPVLDATAEAALRALDAPLIPDLYRGGRIVSQTNSVGGLSQSTTWQAGAPAGTTYGVIDGILSPLLALGQQMRRLSRA